MAKNNHKHVKQQSEEDEGEYEEEEEEYEEEEEEEEEQQKPKKSNLKNTQSNPKELKNKDSSSKKKDKKKALEEVKEDDKEEQDEEKIKLTHEDIKRMNSKISSRKSDAVKRQSSISDAIIQTKKKTSCKEKFLKVFNSQWFSLFMVCVTAWTMISEDLRYFGPKAIDPLFYVIIIILIMIFITEIVLSCIYHRAEYLFSFYFIIDIVITLTLFFFDIGWVCYAMLNRDSIIEPIWDLIV